MTRSLPDEGCCLRVYRLEMDMNIGGRVLSLPPSGLGFMCRYAPQRLVLVAYVDVHANLAAVFHLEEDVVVLHIQRSEGHADPPVKVVAGGCDEIGAAIGERVALDHCSAFSLDPYGVARDEDAGVIAGAVNVSIAVCVAEGRRRGVRLFKDEPGGRYRLVVRYETPVTVLEVGPVVVERADVAIALRGEADVACLSVSTAYPPASWSNSSAACIPALCCGNERAVEVVGYRLPNPTVGYEVSSDDLCLRGVGNNPWGENAVRVR